jgi:hypothetical protein
MADNGHNYPHSFEQRMDRMEAFLQSMVDAFQKQHEQTMEVIHGQHESIRELIDLQKEHRIDIMALFSSQKDVKQRLDDLEKGKE